MSFKTQTPELLWPLHKSHNTLLSVLVSPGQVTRPEARKACVEYAVDQPNQLSRKASRGPYGLYGRSPHTRAQSHSTLFVLPHIGRQESPEEDIILPCQVLFVETDPKYHTEHRRAFVAVVTRAEDRLGSRPARTLVSQCPWR